MRVLLVDDEVRVVAGLRRVLSRLAPDSEFDIAESGPAALDKLACGGWDVVVSDQRMPCMEGTTLLTKVAELAPNVGRILLSGNAEGATALHALFKAHRFLCKPCNGRALLATCREVCQYARAGTPAIGGIVSLAIDRQTYARARAALAMDHAALVAVIAQHPTLAAAVVHTVGSEFLGSVTVADTLDAALGYLGHSGFEPVLNNALLVLDDADALSIADHVAAARARAEAASRGGSSLDTLAALLVGVAQFGTTDPERWRGLRGSVADAALLGLWGAPRALVERVGAWATTGSVGAR